MLPLTELVFLDGILIPNAVKVNDTTDLIRVTRSWYTSQKDLWCQTTGLTWEDTMAISGYTGKYSILIIDSIDKQDDRFQCPYRI